MPSFLDRAREVIAKNQDMLIVFEELDRTGKFRKRVYKTKASFTIDEELFNKFRNYCKRNGINMSGRIENYIREELNKQKSK
jgi:post-segregation antitoxin (ccd killing protein)